MDCNADGVPVGKSVSTGAGALKSQGVWLIVHVVPPQYTSPSAEAHMMSAVKEVVAVMKKQHVSSSTMPLLGAGKWKVGNTWQGCVKRSPLGSWPFWVAHVAHAD
jgi:hypothetical protein